MELSISDGAVLSGYTDTLEISINNEAEIGFFYIEITDDPNYIINPYHLEKADSFNVQSVGVHIRMGDFEVPENEQILREGFWNYRLSI